MIPPHDSLVKYDNPILVSTTKDSKKQKSKAAERRTSQTEDILNSILPPREWADSGQLWVQYVSSVPATRLDVVNLQEALDHKLQQVRFSHKATIYKTSHRPTSHLSSIRDNAAPSKRNWYLPCPRGAIRSVF